MNHLLGHRSHTRWRRMVKQKKYQEVLEKEEIYFQKYVTKITIQPLKIQKNRFNIIKNGRKKCLVNLIHWKKNANIREK